MTLHRKPLIVIISIAFTALLVSYITTEQLMLSQIRSDLKSVYGDDYTILALHMDGDSYKSPSLLKMLGTVYKYKFSNDYEPEGTGGITGKSNYLILLVSDNKTLRTFNWSFKLWKLDYENYTACEWDIIDNLPLPTRKIYQFNSAHRIKRNGVWFVEDINNEDIRFYYREINE